jgi:hypothetical protein
MQALRPLHEWRHWRWWFWCCAVAAGVVGFGGVPEEQCPSVVASWCEEAFQNTRRGMAQLQPPLPLSFACDTAHEDRYRDQGKSDRELSHVDHVGSRNCRFIAVVVAVYPFCSTTLWTRSSMM